MVTKTQNQGIVKKLEQERHLATWISAIILNRKAQGMATTSPEKRSVLIYTIGMMMSRPYGSQAIILCARVDFYSFQELTDHVGFQILRLYLKQIKDNFRSAHSKGSSIYNYF